MLPEAPKEWAFEVPGALPNPSDERGCVKLQGVSQCPQASCFLKTIRKRFCKVLGALLKPLSNGLPKTPLHQGVLQDIFKSWCFKRHHKSLVIHGALTVSMLQGLLEAPGAFRGFTLPSWNPWDFVKPVDHKGDELTKIFAGNCVECPEPQRN